MLCEAPDLRRGWVSPGTGPVYPFEPTAKPRGTELRRVGKVPLEWSCCDSWEDPMGLAGKGVRVEPVWKRGKAVHPGLPKIHRGEEGIRKAAGVGGWRIGSESWGVVEGVICPEPR